jgi:hypothetical protein
MSINLPDHYVTQYANTIAMLLQQKESRFESAVNVGSYIGKQASPVDQIGAISMLPVTTRFAPMGRVDAALDRRWVLPSDFELPQLIDSFDKLRLLNDPSSAYLQNAMMAANRQKDALIYTSMFATAKTGVEGGTSTVFSTAQFVSVDTGGAASGLNLAKLKAAKQLLMANQVDLDSDPIFCAIDADEHNNLLNEVQIVSTDYNDRPVLVDGRIRSFLGINFIHYESVTTATDDQAGTSKQIPIWAKSGMHLGIWNDMETNITQREDLSGRPWQAYLAMTMGATRLEEKKIVRVWAR